MDRYMEVNSSHLKALSYSWLSEAVLEEMRIQSNLSKNSLYLLETGPDHIMDGWGDILCLPGLRDDDA